jgi:hypothetical protein
MTDLVAHHTWALHWKDGENGTAVVHSEAPDLEVVDADRSKSISGFC